MGGIIILLTFLFFQFICFWGDKLWYDSLGFTQRFWIEIAAKAGMIVTGAALSGLLILAFTSSIDKKISFSVILHWVLAYYMVVSGAIHTGK